MGGVNKAAYKRVSFCEERSLHSDNTSTLSSSLLPPAAPGLRSGRRARLTLLPPYKSKSVRGKEHRGLHSGLHWCRSVNANGLYEFA